MHAIKKAIPAALVLAFAGAAQAQVSVYGLIDMSYGKNEFVGEEKATIHSGGDSGSSQGNSVTRFGFKGSTDVGSGVKANFKMESGGITSDGGVNPGGNFFNRQMWLGFSGGFGEVRVGRQDSVPFQVMGNFDLNGQSDGVTSTYSGASVWATGRQSRSVQYMTPDMKGAKIHLGFVPEDSDTTNTDKATASAAASYTVGGLMVGAAFESKRVEGGEDFKSVAASYDFKVAKVMAGYADGPGLYSGFALAKGPSVGIVAPVAGFSVGAQYARDTKNDKDAVTELFVNKEVFKNTYGYAEFGRMSSDNTTKDGDNSFAVGVIYVF